MFKRRKRKHSRRVKTKTRNHFSRHRKTIQSRKNNCETCPTRKEPNKIVFLGKEENNRGFCEKKKTEKES